MTLQFSFCYNNGQQQQETIVINKYGINCCVFLFGMPLDGGKLSSSHHKYSREKRENSIPFLLSTCLSIFSFFLWSLALCNILFMAKKEKHTKNLLEIYIESVFCFSFHFSLAHGKRVSEKKEEWHNMNILMYMSTTVKKYGGGKQLYNFSIQ